MEGKSAICYLKQFPKSVSFSKQILKNHLQPFGVFQIGDPIYANDIIKVYVEFMTLENAILAVNELNNTQTMIGEMTLVSCSPKNGEKYPQTDRVLPKHVFRSDTPTEPPKNVRSFVSNNSPYGVNKTSPENQNATYDNNSSNDKSGRYLIKELDGDKNKPRKLKENGSLKEKGLCDNSKDATDIAEQFMTEFYYENQKGNILTLENSYLLIEKLNIKQSDISYILNLLGSFANVNEYLIDFQVKKGVFSFTNATKIDIIVNSLNGQFYFGQKLSVRKIGCQLPLSKLPKFKNERFAVGEENKKNYRYQKNLSIKFNPPSKTIHVTNIAESLDVKELTDLFGQYYKPLRIKCLSKKTSNSSSKMYLAEFDQVNKCLEILSIFHNKHMSEKSMKISFSHMKLENTFEESADSNSQF